MKLHTDILTSMNIDEALNRAKEAGKVTRDIYFVQKNGAGSRSRRAGYEIQLGTDDKTSGPTNSRRFKNSGWTGADTVYAATYDEWGWFIAQLFEVDPDAIFGNYKGVEDFHEQTKNAYR